MLSAITNATYEKTDYLELINKFKNCNFSKMSSTFSQIYIQIVFAVKGRENLISPNWEEELFKYITRIVRNKDQNILAINGAADHIPILIGIKPACCLSDLVREIKKSSNEFINERKFLNHKFYWQEGFGAFSYSHSALGNVIDFINKQMQHHENRTFRDEYTEFLKDYKVDYKDEYLFDWIE
jgi:putative transposase